MATTQTQRRARKPRSAAAKRRSAAARRAAATRQENQRTPVEQVQHAAQRAVLIPVGAALTATDRVADAVAEFARVYGTPETAQKRVERDLRRFERRGSTARNRAERRIKRTRTRVERELRQRRNRAQRLVRRNSTRLQREVRSVRRDLGKQSRAAQKRVEGVVNNAQDRATTVA
jgi:hypothetical protein